MALNKSGKAIKMPSLRIFPSLNLGLLIMVGSALFGLGGMWPDLFWVAMLFNLGVGAAAMLDTQRIRQADNVTVERDVTVPLSLGAENLITLSLKNRSSQTFSIKLRDEPPHQFQVAQETHSGTLAPDFVKKIKYYITPIERGLYSFGAVNVRFMAGWELIVLQRRFPIEAEVKVYPNVIETKKLQLLSRRQNLSQMGLHALKLKGGGMEFESLRSYVSGDELRSVDWKASARRGKLISREYQLERGQNLMLMLDAGRTMASRGEALTKLDYAVNAALLLTHVAVEQGDRVGLLSFADDVLAHLPLGKGEAQKRGVMETLYALKHRFIESDYRRAFLYSAARLKKRSLIVLFTDLIDPDSSARLISHIVPLVRKHLILCIALSDTESMKLINEIPYDAQTAYQQAVATSLLEDRKKALVQLQAHGVLTLDVSPEQLSIATVNRYLKLKHEMQL
jgi:uncharacterized protein (DUF58 family)